MASVCLTPATPERAVHGEAGQKHKLHPGAEPTTHDIDEDHGPVSPPESPLKPLTDTRPGPEKTREVVQLTLAAETESFPGARHTLRCRARFHGFSSHACTFCLPPANLHTPAQTRSSSASSRRAASSRPTARGPT